MEITHVDGKWWFEHPKPRRFHRCKPVTRGYSDGGLVERCACGAIRAWGRGPWMDKNSRKRE